MCLQLNEGRWSGSPDLQSTAGAKHVRLTHRFCSTRTQKLWLPRPRMSKTLFHLMAPHWSGKNNTEHIGRGHYNQAKGNHFLLPANKTHRREALAGVGRGPTPFSAWISFRAVDERECQQGFMNTKMQPLHHSSAPFRACRATAVQVPFKLKQWQKLSVSLFIPPGCCL